MLRHQSAASCAVACNISNNVVGTSSSVDCPSSARICDDGKSVCGGNYANDLAVSPASKVARQRGVRHSELIPSHQTVTHQPSALLRKPMSSLLSTDQTVDDGEVKLKKRVTFQDQQVSQQQRQPVTKRLLTQGKKLNFGTDHDHMVAKLTPKVRKASATHHHRRGERSSNNVDADGTVSTISPTIIAQQTKNHCKRTLPSIKDLSLLQLVSIVADVTAFAASSAMASDGASIICAATKQKVHKPLAALQVILKRPCKFSVKYSQVSASTEVVDENVDSRSQTGINSDFGIVEYSVHDPVGLVGNGGNSSGVDSEGNSVEALPTKGVELVAPQSTLLRNDFVWKMRQDHCPDPPLIHRLRKLEQEKSIAVLTSKATDPKVAGEGKKICYHQHESLSCNVAEATGHRVDTTLVPLRRIKGLVPPHAEAKNESEKKYIAKLRKIAASHHYHHNDYADKVDDEDISPLPPPTARVSVPLTSLRPPQQLQQDKRRKSGAYYYEVPAVWGIVPDDNDIDLDDEEKDGMNDRKKVKDTGSKTKSQMWQSQPPSIHGLPKSEQESKATLTSKAKDSVRKVAGEESTISNQQHKSLPCHVAEATGHRVDKKSVPQRKIRGLLSPHVETANESEKKYIAKLRKLAASHQAWVMEKNNTQIRRPSSPGNLNGYDPYIIDGDLEVSFYDTLTDSPKGVDELCLNNKFSDRRFFLEQDDLTIRNYVTNEDEDAIVEAGSTDTYEYSGAANFCNSTQCRKSFSSLEDFELSDQHTTRNSQRRHPRRIVSTLIQKVKSSAVGDNSLQSIQSDEVDTSKSAGSSIMVPLRHVHSRCTSTSTINSMSAVYSQDQEKMFDRKACTTMEWVSIPEDVDSVAAKSILTLNTDPMDIHDLTSWNFTLPSENSQLIATARDCNYGNDLDSVYENFGVEQQIEINLNREQIETKFDNAKSQHLSRGNPVDVDNVSASHASLATGTTWKSTDDNAESLVRFDDFGLDWLCGDVNGNGGCPIACQAEDTLERIFDDVGNHISDLVPLCDNSNDKICAINGENHDCITEFDGWTEFEDSADGATEFEDGATPPPKEALVKTNAVRLQSVIFVAPNVKNSRSMLNILGNK